MNGKFECDTPLFPRLFSHCVEYNSGCLYIIINIVESKELAKQFLCNIEKLPKDFVDEKPLVITKTGNILIDEKDWSSITMKENSWGINPCNWLLNDFPNIVYLSIQESSCRSIPTCVISDCPELSIIHIENNCFNSINSFTLSSSYINAFLVYRPS